MDKYCGSFDRFRNIITSHLESVCLILGWFGVCWRVAALIISIILQVEGIADDRPNIFGYMFSIILASYCIFTLSINILFLIGIAKEKPTLILMYVTVQGFEILMMIIYTIFGSPMMEFIGMNFSFWSLTPLYITLLVIFILSFIWSFQLYHKIHAKIYDETI